MAFIGILLSKARRIRKGLLAPAEPRGVGIARDFFAVGRPPTDAERPAYFAPELGAPPCFRRSPKPCPPAHRARARALPRHGGTPATRRHALFQRRRAQQSLLAVSAARAAAIFSLRCRVLDPRRHRRVLADPRRVSAFHGWIPNAPVSNPLLHLRDELARSKPAGRAPLRRAFAPLPGVVAGS